MKKLRILIAVSAASTLVLTGCGTNDDDTTNSSGNTTRSGQSDDPGHHEESADVTLSDGYIREKSADMDMTAIFGTIVNDTDREVNLESFLVEGLSEGTNFELHEVVDGMMREIQGGYTIPADSERELTPGGDHLMIMGNNEALDAGDEYTVVLTFTDGTEATTEIPVRVQPSGEEDYGDMSGHGDDTEGRSGNGADHAM